MQNGLSHSYQMDKSISNLLLTGFSSHFYIILKQYYCKQTGETDQM